MLKVQRGAPKVLLRPNTFPCLKCEQNVLFPEGKCPCLLKFARTVLDCLGASLWACVNSVHSFLVSCLFITAHGRIDFGTLFHSANCSINSRTRDLSLQHTKHIPISVTSAKGMQSNFTFSDWVFTKLE